MTLLNQLLIYRSNDIKSRTQKLTKKAILERVSPISILERYFRPIELNKPYSSPFRRDSTPSLVFFPSREHEIYFVDHGEFSNRGDCFEFVSKLNGLSFMDTLRLINKDFDLKIMSSSPKKGARPVIKYVAPKEVKIQVQIKEFSRKELEYWNQYGITLEILKKFNVYSVSKFWTNKSLTAISSKDDPIFAYYFPDSEHIKVYRPLNKKYKWTGNSNAQDLNGEHLLLQTEVKPRFLTSSLKDVMTLYAAGYSSIAFQSEIGVLTEQTLERLKILLESELKEAILCILYDNDTPGQKAASELMKNHTAFSNLVLPPGPKDPSDFVKEFGIEKLKNFIDGQRTMDSVQG